MLPCSAFAWLVGLLLISAVFRGAVHSMYRPHFTQHPGSPAVPTHSCLSDMRVS